MSQDRERVLEPSGNGTRLRTPAYPSLGAVGAGSNASPHFFVPEDFFGGDRTPFEVCPKTTAAVTERSFELCPGCGLSLPVVEGPTHPYIGASPSCWALFGQVIAREYGAPAYMKAHQTTVDAYAVQHPGRPGPARCAPFGDISPPSISSSSETCRRTQPERSFRS